jgi:NTP pyrophosphatase (non-canonical NTP hydrolase)
VSDIEDLTAAIREFAHSRDWERFHTPKSLAMALSVEVAELVELFQWLTPEESAALTDTPEGRAAIEDEIADVAIYLLRLAGVLGVDVGATTMAKVARNEIRFPAAPSGKEDGRTVRGPWTAPSSSR